MADINEINELVGNKEFEKAKEQLEKVLEEDESNPEFIKLAGLVEVNLKNWDTARNYFETVVKFNMDDATSWFYLAKCYENIGDFLSAKNSYSTVIKLRPEYMEAYSGICINLIKLNNIEDTIKYAQKAKELDNENHLYDFIIGTAYMKVKEFEKAIPYLLEAYEKAPKMVSTLNSLGTCYMATGNSEKAIETYKQALEFSPNSPMTYYNIGSAYQIQQKHKEACEYFLKAVELEEDETFLASLAMSEIKLERYEDALKHYKQLAVLCPNRENYKYNIVTCYEALGDYQTAIKLLKDIVYINPKFVLPAQKLANLYIKTKELNKAKDIYDNILLKQKPTAETLHQYAVLSSSLCDTGTAERILKKVLKMNPNIAKAHKDLGIIYLNKRLFDYADEEFKSALKLMPNDFEILFEYGNFLYSTSRNQEADRYYAESLEVCPKNVLALTFMGLNKLILNDLDSAKEYIMKAVEVEPHHEYVQFCVGRILYARKEFEDAKYYLIRAVEQNPDIETQNTLALTYFELGDYQQALNIFKNIESKNVQSISVLMSIARCYEALQDNDNALKYLDKVVEIFPEDEDAHEMIRRLS